MSGCTQQQVAKNFGAMSAIQVDGLGQAKALDLIMQAVDVIRKSINKLTTKAIYS